MSVRVRFAPSPTGALHIGGVRTALYNYLFAKKNAGKFILRIEDTDQGRFVKGAEDYILQALKWCGIEPEEGVGYGGECGPYRQSERKLLYHEQALELIKTGKAYYAFDTEAELEAMRARLSDAGVPAPKYDASVRMTMNNSLSLSQEEANQRLTQGMPYVIRLRVDPGLQVSFKDIVRDEVSFDSSELDDKVLIKGDGMPTYHMANVIDDHFMRISHVIRGEEWLSSTAHHLLLYAAFGWDHPQFAHLPLLMKPDGKGKLSKRDGATFGFPVFPLSWPDQEQSESSPISLKESEAKPPVGQPGFEGFREYGLEPEALLNFLAFLGWNPGTDQEIFSLEELVGAFDLSKVHKGGARFDIEKAKWFNQQYIRKMSVAQIKARLLPYLKADIWSISASKLDQIISLYQDRVHFIKDFPEQAAYLVQTPDAFDKEAFKKHWKPELQEKIAAFNEDLSKIDSFEALAFEIEAKDLLSKHGLKPGEVFPLFRLALCGSLQGPTVFQMVEVLGKEGVSRIKSQLSHMASFV